MLPKSESRTRPTPIHIITTHHHITITISLSPYTSSLGHQFIGVQPTGRITSHHISRHIRRSGCTILLRVHATPRTDGRHGAFPSCVSSVLALLQIAFLRAETGRNGRNKSLSLVFYLLQNTPYALSFLPSSLALRHFGFFLAWSVGLRRAPEFRARETGEVGYALEGIHGSVKVRWDLRIHASLS